MKLYEGKETFSVSDMRKAFESAAEPMPGNLNRDVNWTARAGWIAPKHGMKGMFYLTSSGEEAVNKKFPGELLERTRLQPNSRRSSKKSLKKS